MAIRLLPFRQYDEQDVVNLFAFNGTVNSKPSDTTADAGMIVKVESSDLSADPVEYGSDPNSYLGKTNYPHVARNLYPSVPLKVIANSAGKDGIGVTLAQTLTHDENDENLLRYPQKKAELYAVTSGEAVPIATKGIFTFASSAVSAHTTGNTGTDTPVVGDGSNSWAKSAANGQIELVDAKPNDGLAIGKVLGAGVRTAQTNADQFASLASGGWYVVVKVDL